MTEVWVVFASGFDGGSIVSVHATRDGAMVVLRKLAEDKEGEMRGLREYMEERWRGESSITWDLQWHGDTAFEAPEGLDRWEVEQWKVLP